VVAVLTPSPLLSAGLFGAAAGLAALGIAPAWAVCVEVGGAHAGVVSGAMNMFGNLGGALSPLVIGFSLERFGSWQAPLLSVAALYIVAAVLWLEIDPGKRIVIVEPAGTPVR
jgi:MFS transporter, ACS family, glucarate transporter